MKGRNKGINMNKKQKIFILALLMGLVGGCKKDPIPEPNPTPTPDVPTDTIVPPIPGDTITPVTPGDTITPVVPGDTIVPNPPIPMDTVTFFINVKNGVEIMYPEMDTLRPLAGLNRTIVLKWKVPPNMTNGWAPGIFGAQRDSLKPRFALSPNIFGDGKIYVNKNYGGASIPCADSLNISILGMTECDSAVFAGWGFVPYVKYSKLREKHIKFIDTIGMSRAILGRTR